MALTDTFVKQVKSGGKASGEKYSDGGGMYLHVTLAGKYWRMAYRFNGKQKTLALGVYPATSLAQARRQRDTARENLAAGIDPATAKREAKLARANSAENTFKAVALEWHAMKEKGCAANTSAKRLTQLENHIFPAIGSRPVAEVKPPEVLALLQAVAARGTAYTAGRLREICGQVFRFAIQTGRATYDPASAMRGAIEKHSQLRAVRRYQRPHDESGCRTWPQAGGVLHRRVLCGCHRHPGRHHRAQQKSAPAHPAVDRHSLWHRHRPDEDAGQTCQLHRQDGRTQTRQLAS
jgi:hypothetical protein